MPKEKMKIQVETIENSLKALYPQDNSLLAKTDFIDALNYTLLAGGKRIRPLLILLFAQLCSAHKGIAYKEEDILPCATALEMVHTYSLIHDDLPAMDNDDLRRGKPTCHVKYNEAIAILTGDALLTDAFSVFMRANFEKENILNALDLFINCAGSRGMVAGQVLDMSMEEESSLLKLKENNTSDTQLLQEMNARKTGDLLKASCCIPALLYNVDNSYYLKCENFAINFGLAFQISDDIMDVISDAKTMGKPQGSDIAANKATWVSLLGLEKAKEAVLKHISLAKQELDAMQETASSNSYPIEALSSLLASLNNRVK